MTDQELGQIALNAIIEGGMIRADYENRMLLIWDGNAAEQIGCALRQAIREPQHCPRCKSEEWFPGAACWHCGWEAGDAPGVGAKVTLTREEIINQATSDTPDLGGGARVTVGELYEAISLLLPIRVDDGSGAAHLADNISARLRNTSAGIKREHLLAAWNQSHVKGGRGFEELVLFVQNHIGVVVDGEGGGKATPYEPPYIDPDDGKPIGEIDHGQG